MELSGESVTKVARILEINEVWALAAHVKALRKKIDGLSFLKPANVMACDTCGVGDTSIDCLIVRTTHEPTEQIDFIGSIHQP